MDDKQPGPDGRDHAQDHGRKRHIAIDTDSRLLMVNLTPADISDIAVARMILAGIRTRWPWVREARLLDFTVAIIRRRDTHVGFEPLPRGRVVERTFGWMTRGRRLVRDDEQRIDVTQAAIQIAMGGLLLRRTAAP